MNPPNPEQVAQVTTTLPPVTLDIMEAVHDIAPKGQLSPENMQQLIDLATRLEAGAKVYDMGLYGLLCMLLGVLFMTFKCPRIGASCQAVGFVFIALIPYIHFTVIGALGFVFCLILAFRKTHE